jgi:hypothetical protein
VSDVYFTDFDGLFLWAVSGVGEDQYTKQKGERERKREREREQAVMA